MSAIERLNADLAAELRKGKARLEKERLPDGHVRLAGRVYRLTPHGSWLTKRNPDGSLHCNHSDRDYCTQDHDTEITYRLVPIEDAP